MDAIGKEILVKFAAETIVEILKRLIRIIFTRTDPEKKKRIIEAAIALQNASTTTRLYIKQCDGLYLKNDELAILWLSALQKMIDLKSDATIEIPEEFDSFLFEKAKFWINPQGYFENRGLLKLVPTLSNIEENIRELLQEN